MGDGSISTGTLAVGVKLRWVPAVIYKAPSVSVHPRNEEQLPAGLGGLRYGEISVADHAAP